MKGAATGFAKFVALYQPVGHLTALAKSPKIWGTSFFAMIMYYLTGLLGRLRSLFG